MSNSTYRVYARRADGVLVGEIDDYTSLTYVKRHLTYGSWRLDLPPYGRAAGLLDMQAGIVVTRDGAPEFSGRVLSLNRVSADKDTLQAVGPDDLYWLDKRVARPVPAGPPYTAAEHDTRTGPAETVIRQYVDVNAGPGALAQYRVPGLVLAADLGRGATVTGMARFDNLLEFVAGLAVAGGLGVRVVQVGNAPEFRVYEPRDLAATVVFSRALGNLREYTYNQQAPDANYLIAGGGGEGAARTFREHGDHVSIAEYGLFVDFVDQRHTADTDALDQAIDIDLERRRDKAALKIVPLDGVGGVAYGRDYDLGDIVTAVIDGIRISDVIREIETTLTPDGVRVRPTIGDERAATLTMRHLFRAQRQVAQRVSHLERST